MIAFVRGTVADVGLTSAVLEVGGVGLQLHVHARHPGHAAHRPRGAAAHLAWWCARTP